MKNKSTDDELSEIIKPLDNTFNRGTDPLLLENKSTIYIISGRRGAGKSTLCLSLLNSKKAFKKRFQNIFLVSPTARNDKKFSKLVEELDDDPIQKFYEEFDDGVVANIFDIVKADNEENEKKNLHCIILDDCVLDIPKKKSSLFNKLIIWSRHHNCSIIIISQKYNAIPTIIRTNADLISFFPSLNGKEITTFQEDINIDKKLFYDIYKKCSTNNTDFMHCNLLAMPPKFYCKFKEIPIAGLGEKD
jgi:hypothetical protein